MRGAFKRYPQRLRDRAAEPIPTGGIGSPPAALRGSKPSVTRELRKIWNELVKAAPPGVMTNADRLALETLCRLVYEARTNLYYMPSHRLTTMRSLLGQFGFSPSSRTAVKVPTSRGKSAFAEF